MAKVIAKYINLPSSGAADSPFEDVEPDDEAIGAISGLYNMGIISGDENGNFNPDDYVTYDEAMVFIINAVGHKIFAKRSGGYPTGYHRIAIQFDMLDDLYMSSGKDDVVVIDVYKMLDSALSASMVETSYYGDGDVRYSLSNTETFLSANYGIKKYRGMVTGNEWTKLTSPVSNLDAEQIEIDGVTYDNAGYIYGYFLGYSVDYYLAKTKDSETALVYVEKTPKANEVIKIHSDDIKISKTASRRIYFENGDKEEHIDFITDMDVIYNSQSYAGYSSLRNILPRSGHIEALDNNNDGVYDVLFIYEFENKLIASVDYYNESVVCEDGTVYEIDDNVRVLSSANGKAIPFGTISKGKVISAAKSKAVGGALTIYVSEVCVSGKITSYSSELGYEIDGKYYKQASAENYYGTPLSIGLEGAFYLDISDKIAMYSFEQISDELKLAVTAGIQYETSEIRDTVTLRIFTSDGKMEERNLRKKVKINGVSYDMTNVTSRMNAVRVLCEGATVLNESYVITYALDDEENISNIEMGNTSGTIREGALNVLADRYTAVRVNYGNMLSMYNDTTLGNGNNSSEPAGESLVSRFSSNKVIFVTPEAGELDDAEAFAVLKGMSLNYFYANPEYFVYAGDQIGITNFSAYSFGTTEFPMTDVMLLRGTGAVAEIGNNSVEFNVISHITEASDDDGRIVPKFYQGDVAIGVLGESVSYTRNGTTQVYGAGSENNLTIEDLTNILKPGDVIQTSKDAKGCIQIISAISEYDYTNKQILPVFSSDGRYIKTSSMYNQPYNNYIVGTVKSIDKEAGVLSFDAGTYTNLASDIATAPVVYVFDADKQKLRVGNVDDIQIGDSITMRIWSGFYAKEVIVFRSAANSGI